METQDMELFFACRKRGSLGNLNVQLNRDRGGVV